MNENSLTRELEKLRSQLRGLYFVHGLGACANFILATFLFSYVLDRLLHLPRSLRLAFLGLALIGSAWFLVRKLFYPLHRKIEERDIALALERRFPELREKLITAIEFSGSASLLPVSEDLKVELQRDAKESLQALPTKRALAPKRAMAPLLFASFLALTFGSVLYSDTKAASIWWARFWGEELRWPKSTELEILIAPQEGQIQVLTSPQRIRVEMVRGLDLPVRVVARGGAPDSVELHLSNGKSRNALRSGEKDFSYLFSSVNEPFSFWAQGGDDFDQEPLVEVTPLQTPNLTRLNHRIYFPSYVGQAPKELEGASIEALAGSEVELFIESSEAVVSGQLRFQQSGRILPLHLQEDGRHLDLRLQILESDRFFIELRNAKGLQNSDTGPFPILSLPDRKPEITLRSPNRLDLDVTVSGRVPIRGRAQDDYGISSIQMLTQIGKDGAIQEFPLNLNRKTTEEQNVVAPERDILMNSAIEITELRAGDRPAHEGEIVFLKIRAADTRLPQPNLSESQEYRLVLLSAEELERRIHEALTRTKEQVQAAEVLQKEKQDRVSDLLTILESHSSLPANEETALRSAFSGQARVRSSAKAFSGVFVDLFESAIYNRLDRDAQLWIDQTESLRSSLEPISSTAGIARNEEEPSWKLQWLEKMSLSFHEGKLGRSELLSKLLEMSRLALNLSERSTRRATEALENVSLRTDPIAQKQLLQEAFQAQKESLEILNKLLDQLAEWDNYQTVIQLTRELLERQRSIHSRTKGLSGK